MKQQRGYPRVTVTPKAERGLAGGHPWVYDTEVADAQPAENGALVDVISAKGRYLGTGFISLHSKIRVRHPLTQRQRPSSTRRFGAAPIVATPGTTAKRC